MQGMDLNLNLDPLKLTGGRIPTSLSQGCLVSAPGLCRLHSCLLPSTTEPGYVQGLSLCWPWGWGEP